MCRVSGICPEGKPARSQTQDARPSHPVLAMGHLWSQGKTVFPSKEIVESLGKEPKPLSAGAQSTGPLSKAAGEVMTWLGLPSINAASHLSK